MFKNCESKLTLYLFSPQMKYVVLIVNNNKKEKAHIIITYQFKFFLSHTTLLECFSAA